MLPRACTDLPLLESVSTPTKFLPGASYYYVKTASVSLADDCSLGCLDYGYDAPAVKAVVAFLAVGVP